MSLLTDLIKEKASEVLADKISIPEGIQEQVFGGIADSIFGILACAFYAKWTKTSFWGYLATTLGFVLMLAESNDYIDKYSLPDSYLVSVVLLLYSGIMMTIGIFKNNKVLKNSGIVVSLFTVVKIIFYDLANVEMTYKLIIFMILGFMFMLISYFYNKNKS